jgi:hypothetical protein
MNANPASGPISETQLLTWTRFADLRSSKSFSCIRMVEAGGVEPPSEKRYEPKTTCLSQFGERPGPCGLIARSPAALRMSKKRSRLVR